MENQKIKKKMAKSFKSCFPSVMTRKKIDQVLEKCTKLFFYFKHKNKLFEPNKNFLISTAPRSIGRYNAPDYGAPSKI